MPSVTFPDFPAPLLPDGDSAPRGHATGAPVPLNLAHAYALAMALRADGHADIARDIERRLARS